MPSYRDLRVALPYPAKIAQLIAEAARQHSHRNRRADRTIGAASLPPTGIAVHHELSYPLSGIHLGAFADSRILDLGGAARLPRIEPGGDGGDAGAGRRIADSRLSQRGVMAARRDRRSAGRRVERRFAGSLPIRSGNFAASLP